MLKLVLPHPRYLASVRKAVSEYREFPSPFDIYAVQKLIEYAAADFDGYFKYVEDKRLGKNLPGGYVPDTSLWLIDETEYAGSFDIRHSLTASLELRGGHIAYEIVPSRRRNGFAKTGLELALAYAKDVLNIERALLTCNEKNTASYRTISAVAKKMNGKEISSAATPYGNERRIWVEMRKEG